MATLIIDQCLCNRKAHYGILTQNKIWKVCCCRMGLLTWPLYYITVNNYQQKSVGSSSWSLCYDYWAFNAVYLIFSPQVVDLTFALVSRQVVCRELLWCCTCRCPSGMKSVLFSMLCRNEPLQTPLLPYHTITSELKLHNPFLDSPPNPYISWTTLAKGRHGHKVQFLKALSPLFNWGNQLEWEEFNKRVSEGRHSVPLCDMSQVLKAEKESENTKLRTVNILTQNFPVKESFPHLIPSIVAYKSLQANSLMDTFIAL